MMSIIFIITLKHLIFAVDKTQSSNFSTVQFIVQLFFQSKYANTSPCVSFKNCETSGAMKQISFETALNFSEEKYLSEK